MRVLIFGDSIAQGFFDVEGGWVDRLRRHYDEILIRDNDVSQPTIFNLGISGDLTRSIVKRVENEIVARKFPGEEFAFIIATGTNDTVYRSDENESEPQQYKKELAEILEIAKKYSRQIMFVGLFPIVDKLLQPAPWSNTGKCYSTERMKLFDSTLKEFCSENNVPCVELWDVFEKQDNLETVLYDGIHPNSKGHELIYRTVQPKLQELLV